MSDPLDLNGKKVHAFALDMANLGLHRMADKLAAMLDDGAWQNFADGNGRYEFLAGEFDYFLSTQGVTREDVMKIDDVTLKARVEEHMDERRTGDEKYRRRVLEARERNPKRGRSIEPFGLTESEAKALVEVGALAQGGRLKRPALGDAVRRWRNTRGETTRSPANALPRSERLFRSAKRLTDDELTELVDRLKDEMRGRKRRANGR